MTTKFRQKIGLMGGSFNPPTIAHRQIAEYAHQKLGFDVVYWLVSPQNPLKSKNEMADFQHRFAMCQIMAQKSPIVTVSDIETRYGTTRTFDLLIRWRNEHPDDDLVWLMGGDNWRQFHLWYRWQEIAAMVPMAIFRRGDAADGRMADLLDCPAAAHLADHMRHSADALWRHGGWCVLDNPATSVSATQIRHDLAAGIAPTGLDPDVLAYIAAHELYGYGAGK